MVLSYTEKLFTVLGQVEHAGTYNLKEQTNVTLLQALGLAGGLTRLADGDHIRIRRVVNGKTEVFRVNANHIAKESSEADISILPGDTITVDERIF
jgi:polysaccharide export outer membrane protein